MMLTLPKIVRDYAVAFYGTFTLCDTCRANLSAGPGRLTLRPAAGRKGRESRTDHCDHCEGLAQSQARRMASIG